MKNEKMEKRKGSVITGISVSLALVCGCMSSQETNETQMMTEDSQSQNVDPNYGFLRTNPIQLGGRGSLSNTEAAQVYLRHLRDRNGRPLNFSRSGSVTGSDGHMVDIYEITSESGATYNLYIDMYHPDVHPFNAKVPRGLSFSE